jgi:hypothetical protein
MTETPPLFICLPHGQRGTRSSTSCLEHLVLAILPSILFINGMQVMPGVWLRDIEALVTSKQCPALQNISVSGGCPVHSTGLECPDGLSLKSACAQFGVKLST